MGQQRDEIENEIRRGFKGCIQTIKYSGSIAKHTAIKSDMDLDLAIHFKKDAFPDLENMYHSVCDFLSKKYNVRKQTVSIGLPVLNVDVVPGRRIYEEEESNNDVFLYRFDNGGRIKTNIEKHKSYIIESGCKDIIKLMKIWRKRWCIDFKSFALELLVVQALKGSEVGSLEDKMDRVLDYIHRNIRYVELIDPANSNNNVVDDISEFQILSIRLKAIECRLEIEQALDGRISQIDAWRKVFNY